MERSGGMEGGMEGGKVRRGGEASAKVERGKAWKKMSDTDKR